MRSLARLSSLPLALASVACGLSVPSSGPSEPFVAGSPDTPGGGPGASPPYEVPPPAFPRTPVWTETAFAFDRTATFGSFPSDVVRLRGTLFVTDADAVEAGGAAVVPIDVARPAPAPSASFAPVVILPSDLVLSDGTPGDAASPPGFGFFVNDLEVVHERLGFALVNAGGSDSAPTCSNLVAFDPTDGTVLQTVDLATAVDPGGRADSTGAPVGAPFRQSQAEGIAFAPRADGSGRLFVAMANLVFGSPSFGAVKLPGTVQVFEVDDRLSPPVAPAPSAVLFTLDHNPVAVTRLVSSTGEERVLVTAAGTTAFDASFALRPASPASVEAFDATSLAPLGRFDLGLVGLSGSRPAVGRDAAGHLVAFVASSVLGEAYLLRLDGLVAVAVDPTRVAVLRGARNPIPIVPGLAGGPGGNVAGLALSPDGRTLLASGFGDFFAFPSPRPGQLYALRLPADLVTSPAFVREFLPGTANLVTTPGRALGPIVVGEFHPDGPEVFVAVSGSLSTTTFLGTGPASLGTLETFGAVR